MSLGVGDEGTLVPRRALPRCRSGSNGSRLSKGNDQRTDDGGGSAAAWNVSVENYFREQDDDSGDEAECSALDYPSLWGISGENPARRAVHTMVRSRKFDTFVIVVIFLNCLLLAFSDPTTPDPPLYIAAEVVFNSLFTVEAALKVFSLGFALHPRAYLRSSWNKVDFLIVILGWLLFVPGIGNFSAVRVVRVLRPLRSIEGIPGLKAIVNALFLSVSGLLNVTLLIGLFFTIFGILGVQLFKGLLRMRCVDELTGLPPGWPEVEGQFCKNTDNEFFGRSCPSDLVCREFQNPDHGYVNFDHIGYAFLLIFQCVTLEGWVEQLYRVQDVWGQLSVLYFVPLIVFGSFYMLNLALAVISEKFHWTKEKAGTALERRPLTIPEHVLIRARESVMTGQEPFLRRIRLATRIVVQSKPFQWAIVSFIFMNTALLAADHEGQPQQLADFLDVANYALTGIFTAEALVKIYAFGPREYCRDYFNILDGCIVLVSLIELVLSSSSSISVFRALRLLRIFKLMKNFPSLRRIVRVVLQAVSDTGYLNVIIVLYLFVSSLIGMQLFGGKFDFEGEEHPRAHFDSFYWSLLTVFQILTRDDWTTPMHDAMRATHPVACLYFVGLVLIGDFIILNLFLAILINSFDMNQDADSVDDELSQCPLGDEAFDLNMTLHTVESQARPAHLTLPRDDTSSEGISSIIVSKMSRNSSWNVNHHAPDHFMVATDAASLSTTKIAFFTYTASGEKLGGVVNAIAAKFVEYARLPSETNGGNALFFFSPNNRLRVVVSAVVTHPYFENCVLALILASSVLLAIDPRGSDEGALGTLNALFTWLFVAELALKVFAFGFVFGEGAYLRDNWNVLDAVVVCISVLSVAFSDFAYVKVFRALRALRPLRVVNRNIGLKVVVRTLLRTLPGVAHVAVVIFLIFLVFAILGVQLFGGRLNYCDDPAVFLQADCVGVHPDSYVQGDNNGTVTFRRWVTRDQHFDHILYSMLTLFEVSTLELWSGIMYSTIDATDRGQGPRKDANPLAGLYFIAFVVVGSFFVMNLFVGVVICNYYLEKKNMEGRPLLLPEQEHWIQIQRLMLTFRPSVRMPSEREMRRAKEWTRAVTCRLVNDQTFDWLVFGVIMLNVTAMGMVRYDSSDTYDDVLDNINNACGFFYVAEAALKIHAWRATYFRDGWNRFDFSLVVLALIGIPLQYTLQHTGWTSSIKLARVLRMVRLLRLSKGMQILLETLWYSLPYLSNIFLFLGLLFFIYATLGVSLFSGVRRGAYLAYHSNFDNFGSAVLLLFRCCTGEDWNGIMHDLMVEPPECDGDCGPPVLVPPLYFISFLLLAAQVMLNLFIAIILDNFSTTVRIEKSKVRMSDLNKFIACWSLLDPSADLLVETVKIPQLLVYLGQPLGISRAYTRLQLLQKLGQLQIPEHGGRVHFVEVLIPLARCSLGISLSEEEVCEQEDGWRDFFPDIRRLPVLRYRQKRVTIDQFFAATYIGASYRRSVARARHAAYRDAAAMRRKRFIKLQTQICKDSQTEDVLAILLDVYMSLLRSPQPSCLPPAPPPPVLPEGPTIGF
ncbi:Muscle calcium channel subunit alpha-1 [Diplonema papillatum]|nr:Muscle calcium channel subunit alpha-1 [Diplonema papillatum]